MNFQLVGAQKKCPQTDRQTDGQRSWHPVILMSLADDSGRCRPDALRVVAVIAALCPFVSSALTFACLLSFCMIPPLCVRVWLPLSRQRSACDVHPCLFPWWRCRDQPGALRVVALNVALSPFDSSSLRVIAAFSPLISCSRFASYILPSHPCSTFVCSRRASDSVVLPSRLWFCCFASAYKCLLSRADSSAMRQDTASNPKLADPMVSALTFL